MRIFTLFITVLCCAGLANATEGALPGGFTINANGDKIQFSKGNLQYNAMLGTHATADGTAQGTWRFANGRRSSKKTMTEQAVLSMDGLTISYGEQADTTTSIRI